jgi:glycosyltransferase involved in cell wall biosynthesis
MVPFTTFLEKHVVKTAHHVTVVSDFLFNQCVDPLHIPRQKVRYVPNGCNTEDISPRDRKWCRKKLGIDIQRRILMYVGRAHHSLEHLLRSFTAMYDIENIYLYCVGRYTIPSHDDRLDVSHIVYTGMVAYTDLALYLGAADILVLPMANTNIEKARWPIRFGDYLSAGRAVVANNIGEIGKVIRTYECGVLVDTIENICPYAKQLLDEPSRIAHMESRARNVAQTRLSWSSIGNTMAVAYE